MSKLQYYYLCIKSIKFDLKTSLENTTGDDYHFITSNPINLKKITRILIQYES